MVALEALIWLCELRQSILPVTSTALWHHTIDTCIYGTYTDTIGNSNFFISQLVWRAIPFTRRKGLVYSTCSGGYVIVVSNNIICTCTCRVCGHCASTPTSTSSLSVLRLSLLRLNGQDGMLIEFCDLIGAALLAAAEQVSIGMTPDPSSV